MPELYDLVMAANQGQAPKIGLEVWLPYLAMVISGVASIGLLVVTALLKREVKRRDEEIKALQDTSLEVPKLLMAVEGLGDTLERERKALWSRVSNTSRTVSSLERRVSGHRDECRKIFLSREMFDSLWKMKDKQDSALEDRVKETTAALETVRRRVEELSSQMK